MSTLDLRAVDAALRKTTEHLAAELANPTAEAPDWTDFEWRMARVAASLHGVSALLARSLRWQGPPDWAEFTEDQRAHTARRHQRLREVLESIGYLASLKGIPIVPLKGAALYALGVYEAGIRPMADLDLLVRDTDHERTARLLESLGFEEQYETVRHRVFAQQKATTPAAFGEHSDNFIKIELHHRGTWEPLPLRPVDITELVLSPDARPGLNSYRSPAGLMAHLLLHAAGAMATRTIRMLHLHDIARVSSRMTDADWAELGAPWWTWPPLALTARYFPELPKQVLTDAAAACPPRLRRTAARTTLSDASLSSLWITTLPGAAWARSPVEMFAYARSRVFLSYGKDVRRRIAAAEPYLSGTAWSRTSRLGLILKLALSRRPRAATLNVVRAALALPP